MSIELDGVDQTEVYVQKSRGVLAKTKSIEVGWETVSRAPAK